MLASISLIARFILCDFKAYKHASTVRRISEVVEKIPIMQNDPSFTCRTWLKIIIDALFHDRIIKLNVSDVDALEGRAVDEADGVMRSIATREVVIDRKSAIPTFDMRFKKI